MMVRTAALIGFALLAAGCSDAAAPGYKPPAEPPPEIGRYQVIFSPTGERYTVLLDTATGRTWKRVTHTYLEDDPTIWEEIDRPGINVTWSEWRAGQTPKDQKAAQ